MARTRVRFFDENNDTITGYIFDDLSRAEIFATARLGTEVAGGIVCRAVFFEENAEGEWVATGEEMEF